MPKALRQALNILAVDIIYRFKSNYLALYIFAYFLIKLRQTILIELNL
jgi:hypothetical protein